MRLPTTSVCLQGLTAPGDIAGAQPGAFGAQQLMDPTNGAPTAGGLVFALMTGPCPVMLRQQQSPQSAFPFLFVLEGRKGGGVGGVAVVQEAVVQ